MRFPEQRSDSILFITVDSCRYDTFAEASIPALRRIGPLFKAMAPGNFTYGSHAAMFVGFTPGVADREQSFVNPKYGKIFKMVNGGFPGKGTEFVTLEGPNIIEGLRRRGYTTVGSAAMGWFDPATETGYQLGKDFEHFQYPGNHFSLRKQLEWVHERLEAVDASKPVFLFMNIGETHVPYYYEGAAWGCERNPCVPFSDENDADECRRRQRACLEFVDRSIAPLLDAFGSSSVLVCADHGDCWGEDGLWEHGIHHEKVYEVPLVFRLMLKDGNSSA